MVIWSIKIFRWVHPPGPVRDVEVELGKTHSQVVKRVGRYSILEDVKNLHFKGAQLTLRQQACVLRAGEPGGGGTQCCRWQVREYPWGTKCFVR